MDLPQLWAELESRWPESIIDPSLTRIVSVMELLGDPQRAYPVIQVAGTNGKTSTARMIESVLRAYGLRTGLFTS
ncbi:MAG: dihydrofolate synthase, partial [Actinomycetota bacterium]